MHVYFSGIGGAGIGPLAQIAHQAGYDVSGSDQQNSQYIDYLKKHGITNISIGQNRDQIEAAHQKQSIDWLVHSSSISPNSPELTYAKEQGIKTTKRDTLINQILEDKNLKMIAIAGTHGKTTTTAMAIWLFKQLGIPVSYSVGAKLPFGDMGQYQKGSKYFIYEADEFDRNFLAYEPEVSLITGVSWDHHEIFPTREDYQQAFREFIDQSRWTLMWDRDADYLDYEYGSWTQPEGVEILDSRSDKLNKITLAGKYNREDALLVVQGYVDGVEQPINDQAKLFEIINSFPGLSRRMEEIIPNLYSDYAHTPEKIRGAMSVALEMAQETGQNLVVVYEPLTNRRQHYMQDDYKDVFDGVEHLYWIPSYLAREDPDQRVIPPAELVDKLSDPNIATPMERDEKLKTVVQEHLDKGDMVVCMAGGGGDSLDDWLREQFKS